jgi:hypothetical protein
LDILLPIKKKTIKKRLYKSFFKYKFLKSYLIIFLINNNKQKIFNIFNIKEFLTFLSIIYFYYFIYLLFLLYYLTLIMISHFNLRTFFVLQYLIFPLSTFIFFLSKWVKNYISIYLKYYEIFNSWFFSKFLISLYNKKFLFDLKFFNSFFFKYNLFSIYKFSYGHSIRWLIKWINFLINKFKIIFSLPWSNYKKYFDYWHYIKQYRFLDRFYAKKSILWKLCNYFGSFNPYSCNFWVYGDQFSSLYILKFTWIVKNI